MRTVVITDRMQKKYRYQLVAPMGKQFDPRFKPDLTPKQMLALGIFGGKYMTDCRKEFPKDWFTNAKLSPEGYNKEKNFFKVKASQSLIEWRRKGWIYQEDPRGWFQWYCRYYIGRRIPQEDDRQIKRWINIRRHIGQLARHCQVGDFSCRTVQRQALLHWAYDSRKL